MSSALSRPVVAIGLKSRGHGARMQAGCRSVAEVTQVSLRVPLSFSQERLWFVDQLAPGNIVYNIALVADLDGPLDLRAFTGAMVEIVDRHESLRTRFPSERGVPHQIVEAPGRFSVVITDLAAAGPRDGQAEARRLSPSRSGRRSTSRKDRSSVRVSFGSRRIDTCSSPAFITSSTTGGRTPSCSASLRRSIARSRPASRLHSSRRVRGSLTS